MSSMSRPNEIYFYSVVTALMSGLAAESVSQDMHHFLQHGDHGLGTFAHMDGEMVVVDGVPYQLQASGKLTEVADSKLVSFGIVTPFRPSSDQPRKLESNQLHSLKDLEHHIDKLIPASQNHFVAFKLNASFKRVKVRAIHAQDYADEPLSELGKTQAVHEYTELKGSLVGFRSPVWSGGFSVPGMHVHFIDEQRTCGGHVLELETEPGASLQAARGSGIRIVLPEGEEFGARQIEVDSDGLAKVEG